MASHLNNWHVNGHPPRQLVHLFIFRCFPSSWLHQGRIEIMWRVRSRNLQPSVEPVESVTLCADGIFRFRHFTEEPCGLINSIFAYVCVLLGSVDGPSFAVSVEVHHPAVRYDKFDGHRFIQGYSHYFIREEPERD